MLIFLRRRIAVAIAVLREASKYGSRVRSQMYCILTKPPQVDFCCFCCCHCFRAIRHITSTLFYPLITFLMLTVCILYWAVTAVYPSVNTRTHTHTQCSFKTSLLPACKHFFNLHAETSCLASSGEPIYKVVSPDVSCPSANTTCTPEVQYGALDLHLCSQC